MKGKKMLIGLGYINRKFIDESENDFITGKDKVHKKNAQRVRSIRRPMLIAAVLGLALLMVGCAVVYVLSLQGLIVSERTPTTQNAEGMGNISLISLQNINQPALTEWLDYLESYDVDGSLMVANDNNESGIPEPYYLVYNCYTWDMVEKLDEIAERYNLQLLSQDVNLQAYAHNVLYDALSFESVVKENVDIGVENLDSSFYPEGTFSVSMLIKLPNEAEEILVNLRYSKKDYFDPVVGSVGDIDRYEQWHYTQADGIDLLLAVDDKTARIYADLPDAFVSIHTDTLSKDSLEQLAEVFNFTIKPQHTTMEKVDELLQTAENTHNDLVAQQQARLYGSGYSEYVKQLIEKYENSPLGIESMTYALYDINGDEMEELIVCNYEALVAIISTKNGESFHYFDANNLPVFRFNICKNNVIEVYNSCESEGVLYEFNHFYFHADIDGASFITGLYKDQNAGWSQYLEIPEPDPSTHKLKAITDNEALSIMSSYEPVELDMKPITDFPF